MAIDHQSGSSSRYRDLLFVDIVIVDLKIKINEPTDCGYESLFTVLAIYQNNKDD